MSTRALLTLAALVLVGIAWFASRHETPDVPPQREPSLEQPSAAGVEGVLVTAGERPAESRVSAAPAREPVAAAPAMPQRVHAKAGELVVQIVDENGALARESVVAMVRWRRIIQRPGASPHEDRTASSMTGLARIHGIPAGTAFELTVFREKTVLDRSERATGSGAMPADGAGLFVQVALPPLVTIRGRVTRASGCAWSGRDQLFLDAQREGQRVIAFPRCAAPPTIAHDGSFEARLEIARDGDTHDTRLSLMVSIANQPPHRFARGSTMLPAQLRPGPAYDLGNVLLVDDPEPITLAEGVVRDDNLLPPATTPTFELKGGKSSLSIATHYEPKSGRFRLTGLPTDGRLRLTVSAQERVEDFAEGRPEELQKLDLRVSHASWLGLDVIVDSFVGALGATPAAPIVTITDERGRERRRYTLTGRIEFPVGELPRGTQRVRISVPEADWTLAESTAVTAPDLATLKRSRKGTQCRADFDLSGALRVVKLSLAGANGTSLTGQRIGVTPLGLPRAELCLAGATLVLVLPRAVTELALDVDKHAPFVVALPAAQVESAHAVAFRAR